MCKNIVRDLFFKLEFNFSIKMIQTFNQIVKKKQLITTDRIIFKLINTKC